MKWRLRGAAAALPALLALDFARCAAAQAMPPGLSPVQQVAVLPSGPAAQLPSLLSAPPRGTVAMRALRLSSGNTPNDQSAQIFLGQNSEYSMGTDAGGNFMIQKGGMSTPILEVDRDNVMHLNARSVQASSLDVASHVSLRGVRQWQLALAEDFSNVGAGWSRLEVTKCAGVSMLGGYCKFAKGEVKKTFTDLPPHRSLRIRATYHFIDRWIGESGYMKLNVGEGGKAVAVWSEQHQQEQSKNGISVCGSGDTPEGKFAAVIDVTVAHTAPTIEITFGSTMADSDPCDESWGVSGVELHTRL